MSEHQKHNSYAGYIIGAALIVVPVLFYLLLPGMIVNTAAFIIYILGILFIASEFGRNNQRGAAFLTAGTGFLLLTFQFFNSDHTLYTVIFILLSSITFLIFTASLIESAQGRKKKKRNNDNTKSENNHASFDTIQDIFGIICSILSIIGFILEFIL